MATVDPAAQTCFWNNFSTATEDIREGLSVGRATAANDHWTKWAYFCARVALKPLLAAYKEPAPILKSFTRDYRTGNTTPKSRGVQSRTVEDVVRSIGQAIAMLGAKDPLMMSTRKIDGRLQLHFRCYSRKNPPPSRVKPIPAQVLRRLACVTAASNDQELQAVTDIIIIAFFFLLRPGDYTGTRSDSTPFCLSDVTFSVGHTVFNTATAMDNELAAATFVILIFSTQKNVVQGEKIGHGATGDPLLCPKEDLRRHVTHLRQQGAPVITPLTRFKTPRGRWINVTPTMITAHLKAMVKLLVSTHLGFTHKDVSARSLRAAGAMTLFCSGVNNDITSLIGRWRSDEILRYLHVKAKKIMRNFSKLMISHGKYITTQ